VDYGKFVFDEIRRIGRAWRHKNPESFPKELSDDQVEHLFEKIGDMAWRRLVDKKPVRRVLEEIGVDPVDYGEPGPPAPGQIAKLSVSEKTFRKPDGSLFSWHGYSWFLGYRKFLRGEDIRFDLTFFQQKGINVVRVFGRLPWLETPDYNAGFSYNRLGEFFKTLAGFGIYCEFVPLCMAFDGARQSLQAAYDIAKDHDNVFIEDANEPHVNRIDLLGIGSVNRYDVLWSCGDYGFFYNDARSQNAPQGKYCTIHTLRDSAWHRKARHAQEFQEKFKRPTISDEPAKIVEPGFNYPGGKNDPNTAPRESVWHHGVCALWTPGSTYHCEDGKWGRIPAGLQSTCLDAIVEHVWNKIGPEWQTGEYNHSENHDSPVDDVDINGQPIWTYTSLHDNRAVSVRCGPLEPKAMNGWRKEEVWGPSNSLVRLVR
jgi:hypothetical protein